MDPGGVVEDTQSPDDNCENEDINITDSSPVPWARLVAIDRSNPDIALWESDTVVGRTHLNGNRKVSKFHCRILKDSSGEVLMSNLSKNGSLINGAPLNNEERCNLQHGDEISLGPRGLGIPNYFFHVLDRTFGFETKRSNEVTEAYSQSDSAKRLKLTKVRDDLKCSICLGVWHDVVTVAPCLHSFCNGCFSEWYKNKRMSTCSCPQCRECVVFVKKNHTLSSIIEDYLQEFPSLRRPSEETAHLDQHAIVGSNFVNVGGGDSCTSDDDDEDETARCPQCPRSNTFTQADDAFVCGPNTLHLQCTTCSMLLPERADTDVVQKCAGCSRVFCGLYWRSQSTIRSTPLMSACIMRKIIERTATNLPVGAFWGNTYEQEVTRRYLQEQGLQIQDVVVEWLGKMDRDETGKPELLPNRPQSPFSGLYFCNQCEEIVVNHLLYKFRMSVPKAALPSDAAGREDCWYGRLCRTQSHRDSHARRYNHVCEPSSRARSSQ
ncbi:hypothetical protein GOP47_0028477 [Adiantum capillus-veneris]|nr:hypothetical protein GOP47_0028477 [Adiantum capillus-veneris]